MTEQSQKNELVYRFRQLRNNPTEAERSLWPRLRNRRLNGKRFRRQMVIGVYIVDFCCPEKKS